MIRVGVTGLRDLTGYDRTALNKMIHSELETLKEGHDKAVLLDSLAAGADQLFAEIGLSLGYELVCPLPFLEYRNDFCGETLESFDLLVGKSSRTLVVAGSSDKDAAYLAAGQYIVHQCDVLLAVWDGMPQASACGTAAVVDYATGLGKEVKVIGP